MTININYEIIRMMKRIINSNKKELMSFINYPMEGKADILAETFGRGFNHFWNSSSRDTSFVKDYRTESEIENEERKAKKKARKNRIKVKAKREDLHFEAFLDLTYDLDTCDLNVEVSETKSDDPRDTVEYTEKLKTELEQIKPVMEKSYTKDLFLRHFIATLHANQFTAVLGTEATYMYTIYKNAKVHYPMFDKVDYDTQIRLMRKGYNRGRGRSNTTKDIFCFSKSTFEVLSDEGLIDVLVKFNPNVGRMKTYYKFYEGRRTRRNPDNYDEIWERNCLIFVTYSYRAKSGDVIRTSFQASDLWNLLNHQSVEDAITEKFAE